MMLIVRGSICWDPHDSIQLNHIKGETPMSVPTSEVALKDYLFNHDAHYRELVAEHRKYEERLNELTSLLHPNDEELIEEAVLKKKKLYIKDQMENIATQYKSASSGH
jgi:uncharacterized protein YdcH (DUF465 family)